MEQLTRGLNEAQAEAVRTTEGPLLIVAGPGSGKTRVLTHRVAALLADGVPAWWILAVTFTNKAAGEMRERLNSLVGDTGKDLWVMTFHKLCVRLLRKYANYVNLAPDFTILDQDDATKIMKAAVLECGVGAEDTRKYLSLVSYAKNNLTEPSQLENAPMKLGIVAEAYEKRKRAAGVVDFDDLLTLVHYLCGIEEVRSELQDRFGYVMVDEYQDTNRVQYEIMRTLTWESRNLCVVGDRSQAIFSWRGAFPGVLEGLLRDFPETKTINLGQNYRSTKKVVALSAAVISSGGEGGGLDLWTENATGEAVRLASLGDDKDEAAWVVGDLRSNTGTSAVIVRTNAQTKPFEDALMAARTSFQLVGAQRFFDRQEVRDVMAWLRAALNGLDYLALTRAAGSPKRGLGEKTLAGWFDLANQLGVAPLTLGRDPESLAVLGSRGVRLVHEFSADVERVAQAALSGPAAAIKAVIAVGLIKEMETERVENVNQLLSSATDFVGEGTGTLDLTREFVESVALTGAVDAGSEGAGSAPVYLITAHAAKGREFDNVYVVGVEDDIYPHAKTEGAASLAEERRLLFVAVSRARTKLTLSWCGRRNRFGKYEDAYPSPFLEGLEDHVDEIVVTPTRRDSWTGTRGILTTPPSSGYGGGGSPSAARAPFRLAPMGPPPEAVAVDVAAFPPGQWVHHERFGDGEVLEVKDTNAKIRFSSGVKTLVLGFAKLVAIEAPQ